jgi:hypothetical protein
MNSKILFFLSIFTLFGEISYSQEVECTKVNGQITSRTTCRVEPEKLIIKLYKIGVCTNDPMPAGRVTSLPPDFSSCQTVFENTNGATISITNKIGSGLIGQMSRPWGRVYPYSYTILSPDMGVQTSVTFSSAVSVADGSSSGTTCWTKSGTMWALATDTSGFVECGSTNGVSYGTLTTAYNTLGGAGVFSNEQQFYSSTWSLRDDNLYLTAQPTASNSYGGITRFVSYGQGVTIPQGARTLDLGFSVSRAARIKFDSNGNLKYIKNGEFETRLVVNGG